MKNNEEIAFEIGKLLNGPYNAGEIGKIIANKEHRFLQSVFWNMVEGYIQEASNNKNAGYFDDRNAYAVKMANKIQGQLDIWRAEIAKQY